MSHPRHHRPLGQDGSTIMMVIKAMLTALTLLVAIVYVVDRASARVLKEQGATWVNEPEAEDEPTITARNDSSTQTEGIAKRTVRAQSQCTYTALRDVRKARFEWRQRGEDGGQSE